jgi:hypothetical protein
MVSTLRFGTALLALRTCLTEINERLGRISLTFRRISPNAHGPQLPWRKRRATSFLKTQLSRQTPSLAEAEIFDRSLST